MKAEVCQLSGRLLQYTSSLEDASCSFFSCLCNLLFGQLPWESDFGLLVIQAALFQQYKQSAVFQLPYEAALGLLKMKAAPFSAVHELGCLGSLPAMQAAVRQLPLEAALELWTHKLLFLSSISRQLFFCCSRRLLLVCWSGKLLFFSAACTSLRRTAQGFSTVKLRAKKNLAGVFEVKLNS